MDAVVSDRRSPLSEAAAFFMFLLEENCDILKSREQWICCNRRNRKKRNRKNE